MYVHGDAQKSNVMLHYDEAAAPACFARPAEGRYIGQQPLWKLSPGWYWIVDALWKRDLLKI